MCSFSCMAFSSRARQLTLLFPTLYLCFFLFSLVMPVFLIPSSLALFCYFFVLYNSLNIYKSLFFSFFLLFLSFFYLFCLHVQFPHIPFPISISSLNVHFLLSIYFFSSFFFSSNRLKSHSPELSLLPCCLSLFCP